MTRCPRSPGHAATRRETTAERMLLHVLQGHCNSPIAGYAQLEGSGELSLRAKAFTPDGKTVLNAHEWVGPPSTPRPSAHSSQSACCVRAHAN